MLNSSPKELESKAQNLAERIQRSPIAKKIDIKVLPDCMDVLKQIPDQFFDLAIVLEKPDES